MPAFLLWNNNVPETRKKSLIVLTDMFLFTLKTALFIFEFLPCFHTRNRESRSCTERGKHS